MVSSRLAPAKPGAIASMRIGVASTPTSTIAETTTARSAATAPATRSASLRSPRASSAAYTGMKDADKAPSPKRFWRKFGMRNAALNASASVPRPKKCAKTRCRTRPVRRVSRMPTATKNADRPVRGALVDVFIDRRGERAAGAFHQVRLDEHVDVAVEHPIDVADLLLGPVILHHLVRMQHVASDLAAERDVALLA